MEANVKLLDAPLTDEDFEVLYAVYENNLLGLFVYPRLNCSLTRRSRSVHSGFVSSVLTLHTPTAPAVRAAVKTELSYRNGMIIAFFFAGNKIKTMLKLVWPLLIIKLRILGLI